MNAADFTVAPQEELAPWAEEMLQEQEEAKPAETAEPQQQDPAANDVILFQVPALAVGDARGLADLIIAHPDLYEQILATAASFLGNDTLAKALDIVHGAPAEEQAEPPRGEETTPPDVIEAQASEETSAGTEEVTKEEVKQEQAAEPTPTAAEPEPEAGWVVRARAFNANHSDEVQLFNHATGYTCVDANGEVDPNAVANWQSANGVSPDGRVGKETADAAWTLMPVEQPAAPQQLEEQSPEA